MDGGHVASLLCPPYKIDPVAYFSIVNVSPA